MDVKKLLKFKEIKFLYDALKADIKNLNDKIDFIAKEIKDTINNLSDEDKKKLEKGEYVENLKKYGRIINKAYLEEMEVGENVDYFADLHTEFLKQKNQNLTAFKREMPKTLKTLENLTEEQWEKKEDIDKIEIERYIRNQSYFVAEAMLPAINMTKYEKNPNKQLGEKEQRYNEKVYDEKDKAMINFLVKIAEANEMLEPQKKHFAGLDEDKALSTLNISVHFGKDDNLERIFMEANEILGREEYPTTIEKIQEEFGYKLPHFINDKGLISHKNENMLGENVVEFINKVLKVRRDENGKKCYEVDEENLDLYINFLHQDLTEREILHIANEINYINRDPIVGRDTILNIKDLLEERENSEETNISKRSADYVKNRIENTEDRESLILKLQTMFLKGTIVSNDSKRILDLNRLKEYKNILVQAGIGIEEIEKHSQKLEKGLIKIILNDKKEVEQILQRDNIHLRKNPNKLFVVDKVMENLKRNYGFSNKRERMELIDLNEKELNRSLIDKKGRFNKTNFARICSWGKVDCVKKAVEIANSRNINVKDYVKEDNYQR